MSNGPKEDIYDEKISPLVKQIIKLCHEHEINSMLHFILDENTDEESEDFGATMTCHTYIGKYEDDEEELEKLRKARDVLRPRPIVMTMAVYGSEGD